VKGKGEISNGFAACKEVSIQIAKEIKNSEIYYGLYFPLTPRHTWDFRWWGSKFFTHFWVEFENRIIDCAKQQFGEPFVSIAPIDDIRYVKVGRYDYVKDTCTRLVQEPKILWDTYENTPIKPVKVVWAGYEKHLEKLDLVKR
jgi:hypothetical protein